MVGDLQCPNCESWLHLEELDHDEDELVFQGACPMCCREFRLEMMPREDPDAVGKDFMQDYGISG